MTLCVNGSVVYLQTLISSTQKAQVKHFPFNRIINTKIVINMKKAFIMMVCAVAIFATSCTKDSTYQISNKTDFTLYDVVVFEFYGNDVVGQKDLGNIVNGSASNVVTASDMAEKVKVSMCFVSGGDRYYAVQSYYLDKGKNTKVDLTDNTMVSGSLNSKDTGSPIAGQTR